MTINDSTSATPSRANVRWRGLAINGSVTNSGLNGVRFFSGTSSVIDQLFIQNQQGTGVLVDNSSGTAVIAITNSVLSRTGSATVRNPGAAEGHGLGQRIAPRVDVFDSPNNGARVDASATTGRSMSRYSTAMLRRPCRSFGLRQRHG